MKQYLFIVLFFCSHILIGQTRNFRLVNAPTKKIATQQRKAIVIGMSNYGDGRDLNNTINDANDMFNSLKGLGFEVTLLTNNDLRSLKENLSKWYGTIEGNDMAIFYFAGHGMEVKGENYLIPVGANMSSETDVVYNTLNVNNVLENMDAKKIGMKLVILDACRDNPFKRSWTRGTGSKGLAQVLAPKGTYVAFAASPGSTAQDGGNYKLRNGVFTHYLKQEIVKKGLSIDEVFTNVANQVTELTGEQQTPFRNSSLQKNFYFLPSENNPSGDSGTETEEKVKKYFYYIDDNGNESKNHFDNRQQAEGEMKAKKLFGKIYSNMGDVIAIADPNTSSEPASKKLADVKQKLAEANKYYKSDTEKDKALEIYINLSEKDLNGEIMKRIAAFYAEGEVVKKNEILARNWFIKSKKWYQQLVNGSNASAMIDLANMHKYYQKYPECNCDSLQAKELYLQAKELYLQSAEIGNTDAMIGLGQLYGDGLGDYTEALNWYIKSANLGNTDAMFTVGAIFKNGLGGEYSFTKAKLWFEKAANKGNTTAMFYIGYMYEVGSADFAKDLEQAKSWYTKAAENGNRSAKQRLSNWEY
jgi:uncharacterized caspase-like protein/TPR repeat protein